MAGSEARQRTAAWREQSAKLKEEGRAWRESEQARRGILRALVKPALAAGLDLKQLTADAAERFEKRCADANAASEPKKAKARANGPAKKTAAKPRAKR